MNLLQSLLLLSILTTFKFTFCTATTCINNEREALLRFKQGVQDPSNNLASWIPGGDCCKWTGVVCSNITGHVLELHLGNPYAYSADEDVSMDNIDAFHRSDLVGEVNASLVDSSLVDLTHLSYLDLSYNSFQGNQIPKFIGSLRNLRYLNLSGCSFGGIVSDQLGNLTELQYLDLRFNGFGGPVPEIGNLVSLRFLDLSENDFNSSFPTRWGNLTRLEYLSISKNEFLQGKISLSFAKLCSLRFVGLSSVNISQDASEVFDIFSGCISDGLESLDLSKNQIYGKLNDGFGKFRNLRSLVLNRNSIAGVIPGSVGELLLLTNLGLFLNKLEGQIPVSIGNLSKLRYLDLSSNRLNGSIPFSLGKLSHLKNLYLENNNLSGPIPFSIGKLSFLKDLSVSGNKLNGMLSEIHVANLTSLRYLRLEGNSLSLRFNSNWIPPFQLYELSLESCHLGPLFPNWIFSQKELGYLELSNTGIEGILPDRFWTFCSQLIRVNISHNQIQGKIPDLSELPFRTSLDFSWNRFSGVMPRVSLNVTRLDFSNNELSGSISQFLCDKRNETNGLKILNLRSNSFSGELPDCWTNWEILEAVYLDNNNFVGHVPSSMGMLTNIQSLHLRNNKLSGVLPASLGNCTQLLALDLGENQFTGNVPTWIGESFSSMRILNLRSNAFAGHLPRELCHLNDLQILDVASNNLSGTIPGCFSNFSAMVTVDYSAENDLYHFVDFTGGIMEDAFLVMKGSGKEFDKILNLVRVIDLSDNNLSGQIPEQLTKLKALQSLNLSYNSFIGNIPESISFMSSLEVIDFSANKLSGRIPAGFSGLNFLSNLNLSDNHLTGKIPSSTQLQSFDSSSYAGNNLCGPPLPPCSVPVSDNGTRDNDTDDEHEDIKKWFYISTALGFVVGFCGLLAPLYISKRWSHNYNLFLDKFLANFVNK